MPMGQLTQVLRDVNPESDPRLLVGPQTIDDAGVVLLGQADGLEKGVALVQTVDYFPPVLDPTSTGPWRRRTPSRTYTPWEAARSAC